MWSNAVVSIHLAPHATELPQPVSEVVAVAGRGLTGDRYFEGRGTYSKRPEPARECTLIEMEALEALERDYGLPLGAAASRRNVATRGVPLNHLVGRRFRMGEAELEGIRLCEPCQHLAEMVQSASARQGLIHRGGLRARIVAGGKVRVGDSIALLPE